MTGTLLTKAFFALIFDKGYCSEGLGKDNGLGNSYIWANSLESGMQMSSQQKKPIMLIIHHSSCPACMRMKSKFASSKEIQTLSRKFIMVNLVDDEEPNDATYAPDGTYVPRILFISPDGRVDRRIYNQHGSVEHKFFYSKPEHIAVSMKKAIGIYRDPLSVDDG